MVVILTLSSALAQESKPGTRFYSFRRFEQSNMEAIAGSKEQDKGPLGPRLRTLVTLNVPRLNRKMGQRYPTTFSLNRKYNDMGPPDRFGRTLGADLPQHYCVCVINAPLAGADLAFAEGAQMERESLFPMSTAQAASHLCPSGTFTIPLAHSPLRRITKARAEAAATPGFIFIGAGASTITLAPLSSATACTARGLARRITQTPDGPTLAQTYP